MSQIDCSACSELQQLAPDFAQNGVTARVAASLKNNTGFNPSNNRDNCEDLNDANDCLVGRMDGELEQYEMCDWKEYMHKLVPNQYEVNKAMIASNCGVYSQIDKIWCWLNHLTETSSATFHAYVDDDPTKEPINGFRIAEGVEVRADGAPMRMSILGQIARITGSLRFTGKMPSSYTNGQDVRWLDFYDGGTDITTIAGATSRNGNAPSGGLFVYEYQINPCDYGFAAMFTVNLTEGTGGRFTFKATMTAPGGEYPYDYGYDENGGGQIYNPSDRKLRLLQVRLINMDTWGIATGGAVTPNGITGVRPCPTNWDC